MEQNTATETAHAPHDKFIEALKKTGHFTKETLGVIGKVAIETGLVVIAQKGGVSFDIETGKFIQK